VAFAPRSAEVFDREVDSTDNPASLSLSTRSSLLHLSISGSLMTGTLSEINGKGNIMSSRVLNYLLLIIIFSLVIALITTNKFQRSTDVSRSEHFLINFDQKDFNRLKEMVSRFKEGKGDNLMIIPPIIDGGYWIHDVMSNGREIYWVVDNSRDGMSSDRGKVEYIC
jgi:hypothetical protein